MDSEETLIDLQPRPSRSGHASKVSDCWEHVRDSEDRTGPHLVFTPAAWAEFVAFAARTAGV
ncbi:DUF397 domain-containing protein [Streptomyces sp. KR80]|uniref:DUF397 domain-containing protein n=1 Tax=Streptomyces sp. KR80 TaxID=3457426 RepID=UPI003FD452B4